MPVFRGHVARVYLNVPLGVLGGVFWLSSYYGFQTKDSSRILHLPQSEALRRRG